MASNKVFIARIDYGVVETIVMAQDLEKALEKVLTRPYAQDFGTNLTDGNFRPTVLGIQRMVG